MVFSSPSSCPCSAGKFGVAVEMGAGDGATLGKEEEEEEEEEEADDEDGAEEKEEEEEGAASFAA
jgi:hypothetical protein